MTVQQEEPKCECGGEINRFTGVCRYCYHTDKRAVTKIAAEEASKESLLHQSDDDFDIGRLKESE